MISTEDDGSVRILIPTFDPLGHQWPESEDERRKVVGTMVKRWVAESDDYWAAMAFLRSLDWNLDVPTSLQRWMQKHLGELLSLPYSTTNKIHSSLGITQATINRHIKKADYPSAAFMVHMIHKLTGKTIDACLKIVHSTLPESMKGTGSVTKIENTQLAKKYRAAKPKLEDNYQFSRPISQTKANESLMRYGIRISEEEYSEYLEEHLEANHKFAVRLSDSSGVPIEEIKKEFKI